MTRYLTDRFSDTLIAHAGAFGDGDEELAIARAAGVEVTRLSVTSFLGREPVELTLSDGSTSQADAVVAAGEGAHQRDVPAPVPFVLAGAEAGQHAAVWIEQHLFHRRLAG